MKRSFLLDSDQAVGVRTPLIPVECAEEAPFDAFDERDGDGGSDAEGSRGGRDARSDRTPPPLENLRKRRTRCFPFVRGAGDGGGGSRRLRLDASLALPLLQVRVEPRRGVSGSPVHSSK